MTVKLVSCGLLWQLFYIWASTSGGDLVHTKLLHLVLLARDLLSTFSPW
jgi:hypothetical protein